MVYPFLVSSNVVFIYIGNYSKEGLKLYVTISRHLSTLNQAALCKAGWKLLADDVVIWKFIGLVVFSMKSAYDLFACNTQSMAENNAWRQDRAQIETIFSFGC